MKIFLLMVFLIHPSLADEELRSEFLRTLKVCAIVTTDELNSEKPRKAQILRGKNSEVLELVNRVKFPNVSGTKRKALVYELKKKSGYSNLSTFGFALIEKGKVKIKLIGGKDDVLLDIVEIQKLIIKENER